MRVAAPETHLISSILRRIKSGKKSLTLCLMKITNKGNETAKKPIYT